MNAQTLNWNNTPQHLKKITKLLIIFLLFPTIIWSQNQEKDTKIWNRFAVGIGYDFLGIKFIENQNRNPFDFKIRYELSDYHSFYINIPFRNKKENIDKSDYSKTDRKEIIRGYGIGYQYNILKYKSIKIFTGIGFDYYLRKDFMHSYEKESLEEYQLFHTMIIQNKLYALSPQLGLSYRWKFFEGRLEYKYDFALSKYVEKSYPEVDPITGAHPKELFKGKDRFRSFDGLNLGLFIHF